MKRPNEQKLIFLSVGGALKNVNSILIRFFSFSLSRRSQKLLKSQKLFTLSCDQLRTHTLMVRYAVLFR